ncbi:MAG: glycosyltransferase [Clostridia bacterium]|nr:glycosyltransferase [Clostridia bacterium]
MKDFIINCVLWICALYGIIEIIKTLFYIHSCNKIKTDGINIIVTVKNQEDKIEGFLRSLNFRLLYGKEDYIENIIVLDLNSIDNTKKIIENLTNEFSSIKLINWNEFEELFSPK